MFFSSCNPTPKGFLKQFGAVCQNRWDDVVTFGWLGAEHDVFVGVTLAGLAKRFRLKMPGRGEPRALFTGVATAESASQNGAALTGPKGVTFDKCSLICSHSGKRQNTIQVLVRLPAVSLASVSK